MLPSAGAITSIALMLSPGGVTLWDTLEVGLPEIVRSLNGAEEPLETPEIGRTPELVVHFDINETVLIGDDAGGDSREDSLNKILAKSAFVKIPDGAAFMGKSMDDTDSVVPTHWWDGSLIGDCHDKIPPLYTGWHWPEGCCPYYRTAFKRRAKQFVNDQHGKPYLGLYHELQRQVAFDHPMDGLPNILSHLLPALFETMQTLSQRSAQQRIRFVFRTFGTDLPDMAQAVTAFSRGLHPDYPTFIQPHLELSRDLLFRGRWKNGVYHLLRYHDDTKDHDDDDSTFDQSAIVASGDAAIIKFLSSLPICGIQDDYKFWASNEWEPWAGKPIWMPNTSANLVEHHVLLDDNIHNLENDSIASIRREATDGSGTYEFLSGREIQQKMQGLHLIRVPTLEPVLNRQWFVEQLDKAQARFDAVYFNNLEKSVVDEVETKRATGSG